MKITQKYQARFIHTILPEGRLDAVRRIGKAWIPSYLVDQSIKDFLCIPTGKSDTEYTWEELIEFGMRPSGLLDFSIEVDSRTMPLSNRDAKRLRKSIYNLVSENHDNLWSFYRSCYKYVDCGPSIGFRIDGDWVYCSDLPDTPLNEIISRVDGVSVSSIVEGSDVEVDGYRFTKPFKVSEFWKAVDNVNDEASFYWERDNSRWFCIDNGPHGAGCASMRETWGEWVWDEDEGDAVPVEDKRMLEQALSERDPVYGEDRTYTIGDYTVVEYLNDCIWG